MKIILKSAATAAIVLLFSGCASIFTKSTYDVRFESDPADATITVKDHRNMTLFKGQTPVTVPLAASPEFFSRARYTVEYTKEGYESVIVPLHARVDGWYFGNILIGGLIGMLIVDPATGAMYKLDDYVFAEMVPVKNKMTSLRVLDINDGPESWKAKLVAIR